MKKKIIYFLMLALFFSSSSKSRAQDDQLEFIRNQSLTLGFHGKYWKLKDNAGSEIEFLEVAFPIVYSVPVSKRLALDVVTAPFGTVLKPSVGDKLDLTSVSDTYVRGSYLLGDNRALLTFGVGIPSGKTELNSEETDLAGIAASRPLANPVTNFGTGLNVNIGLAVAREMGSWIFGLGAGYSRRGEYNLNEQGAKIDPGDEFNITVGVDRDLGSAKFIGDVIYTNYSKDESEVLDPFEAGDKILYSARLILPSGFLNPLVLSASYRQRLDNKTSTALLIENGNELELRATGIAPVGSSFGLSFLYLARIYSETDQGFGGANIQGFGGGIIMKLSRHFTFNPTLIYSTGTINTGPGAELDVTGIELSGGFAFRF